MRRAFLLFVLLPALLLPGVAARMLCLCGIAGEERRPRCCTACDDGMPPRPDDPKRSPAECEGCIAVPLVFDLGSRPELPRPHPLALVELPQLLPAGLECAVVPPAATVTATAHPPPTPAFRLPLRI
jgi:hypothetical protein